MKKNSVHNCGHNTPLYSKAKINFVFPICRVQKHNEKAKKLSTSVCFRKQEKKTPNSVVKQFGKFTTNSSSNMKLQEKVRVAL